MVNLRLSTSFRVVAHCMKSTKSPQTMTSIPFPLGNIRIYGMVTGVTPSPSGTSVILLPELTLYHT